MKVIILFLIILTAVSMFFFGGRPDFALINKMDMEDVFGSFGGNTRDFYYYSKSRFLKEMAGVKYKKEDKKEEGKKYFDDAEKMADLIREPEKKVEALMKIVQKRIETDKTEMKEEIIEGFQKVKEIIDTVSSDKKNELAESLALAGAPLGDPQIIFQALNEVSSKTKSSTLFNIAKAYLEEGKIDLAQEVASRIEDSRYKSAFLIMLIENITETGDPKNAEILASKIDNPIYRAYGFLKILRFFVKKGNLEDAKNLALNSSDDLFRKIGLLEVANAYINKGDFDAAYDIFLILDPDT